MLTHTRARLVLAGVLATLLLGLTVGTATANRISIGSPRFRTTWSALRFVSEATTFTECPVTIEGSFHSATIRKVRGALMGYISRAVLNSASCTGGEGATILQESLPWHVTYDAFTGLLPSITQIHYLLHRVSVRVRALGVECLYATDATRRIFVWIIILGGVMTGATPSNATIPRVSGSFLCPTEAGIAGTGQVTGLGNTSRIGITLI
jgi:hypothetical protein